MAPPQHDGPPSRAQSSSKQRAFTLVELMCVAAILAILMTIAVPVFSSIGASRGVESASYDIAGALQTARAYAMSHKTHVWVGFYEEDATARSATTAAPPYTGKGRVVVAAVASKDGTPIFGKDDAPQSLPADRTIGIGRVTKIENVHLADLGAPSGGEADTLSGRPDLSYTDGPNDSENRVSSESGTRTAFPFTAGGYTFYKTIRFNPRGEADINGGFRLRRIIELGVRPTRSNVLIASDPNVAAVQLSGLSGNVKIYRR